MQQLGHWKTKTGKPGPKKRLLEDHTEALKKIVTETPDATLYEIRDKLSIHVSHQTVANELDLLNLVYKKKRSTPPNKTGICHAGDVSCSLAFDSTTVSSDQRRRMIATVR